MAQNRCSALLDHIDMIASVGVVTLAVKRRYQTGNDDDPSVSSSGIGKKSVPTMFSFPKCFSHFFKVSSRPTFEFCFTKANMICLF